MKLSCTPFSLSHSFRARTINLRQFIRYCAEMGLDGVELLDRECYPWSWSSPDDHRCFKEWLTEANLELAAYSCSNNFAISDPLKRQAQVDLVKRSIERAAASGASIMRIFGGYHASAGGEAEMTTERGLPLVIEGIEKCLETASRFGVILALENHGILPGHSSDSLRVLDVINSPWLKLTFDVGNYQGNSMPEDEDPIKAYEALRSEIVHIHLKDVRLPVHDLSRRREPCVVGLGITPIEAFIERLKADNYSGYGSLEYSSNPSISETEGVTQSLKYLKSLATGNFLKDELVTNSPLKSIP